MKGLSNRQLSLVVERITSEINKEIDKINEATLEALPKDKLLRESKLYSKIKGLAEEYIIARDAAQTLRDKIFTLKDTNREYTFSKYSWWAFSRRILLK